MKQGIDLQVHAMEPKAGRIQRARFSHTRDQGNRIYEPTEIKMLSRHSWRRRSFALSGVVVELSVISSEMT